MPVLIKDFFRAGQRFLNRILLGDEEWHFASPFPGEAVGAAIRDNTQDIRQAWVNVPKLPSNMRFALCDLGNEFVIIPRSNWVFFAVLPFNSLPVHFKGRVLQTSSGSEIQGYYGLGHYWPYARRFWVRTPVTLALFCLVIGVLGLIDGLTRLNLFDDLPIKLAAAFLIIAPLFFLPPLILGRFALWYLSRHRDEIRLFLEWVTLHGPNVQQE